MPPSNEGRRRKHYSSDHIENHVFLYSYAMKCGFPLPPSDEGRRQSRHKVPSALFTVAFSSENDGRRMRNKKTNLIKKYILFFTRSSPCAFGASQQTAVRRLRRLRLSHKGRALCRCGDGVDLPQSGCFRGRELRFERHCATDVAGDVADNVVYI